MLIPDMREKLFLLDWGKECGGARYAIIKSPSREQLGLRVDGIGDPSDVKAMEIDNGGDNDGFYVELIDPKKAYANRLDERWDSDSYSDGDELGGVFDEGRKEWFPVC
tara:strand:- start:2643 stop:2966 length:324 start_codon:yes stop_codon:yes gene_type:complete